MIWWFRVCVQFKLGGKLSQRWYVYYQRQKECRWKRLLRRTILYACALKPGTAPQCRTIQLHTQGSSGYCLISPFWAPIPSFLQHSFHSCQPKHFNTSHLFLQASTLNTFLNNLDGSTCEAQGMWILPPLLIISLLLFSFTTLLISPLQQGPCA